MIEQLDMSSVKNHYDERFRCHQKLVSLFSNNNTEEYLNLALGISDPCGNYSASEHHLGERILANNSHNSHNAITNLAHSLFDANNTRLMLESIYRANLSHLKISVGSEMAMMLKPDVFWVGNVRTIWTHLLCKHNYDLNLANEELALYRDQNSDSEMYYKIWSEIYRLMNVRDNSSIDKICDAANDVSLSQNVETGKLKYMWFDAISSGLYDKFAN